MTTTETLRVPFELNISSIVAADNCHSQPKFAIDPHDPLKTHIPDIQPDLTVITTLRRPAVESRADLEIDCPKLALPIFIEIPVETLAINRQTFCARCLARTCIAFDGPSPANPTQVTTSLDASDCENLFNFNN